MSGKNQHNRKDLTKEQILNALNATLSIKSASRYLGVSYPHLRNWMKFYDGKDGSTMIEDYGNRGGKGMPRYLTMNKEPKLLDLLNGRIDIKQFSTKRIKYRLIEEGYLEEKCNCCAYSERRMSDYKTPLLINFKDKNKNHWRLENLELLCYNCFFIYHGDVFNKYDIHNLESINQKRKGSELGNLELDDFAAEKFKELQSQIDEISEQVEEKKDHLDYDILAYKNKPKNG